MNSIKINEFINKFDEYLKDNGKIVESDDDIFKIAAYKYLNFPAIKDYYNNVYLLKDSGSLEVAIKYGHSLFNVNFLNLSSGFINVCNKSFYGNRYILNDNEIKELEEFFKNLQDSKKFSDLNMCNLKNKDLILKVSSFLNSEEVKFLNFIDSYNFAEKENLTIESELLNANIFNNLMYYTDLKYKSTDIENLINLQDEKFESESYFKSIMNLLSYDGISFLNESFKKANYEDKVQYFKTIINKNPDSLLYTLTNSKNIIYDVIDKFIYPDFKNSLTTKLKYSLKNKTIEKILENEDLNNFMNQISSELVYLNKPLSDRIEHFIWTSEFLRNQTGTFKKLIDKCEIYDDHYKESYFKIQFEKTPKSINDYNLDFNDHDILFIGKDNYNPYYIIQAEIDTPLSMNADSIEVLSVSIGKSITKDMFIEAFDNIFLYALQKKEVLHFSQRIFLKTIEGFEKEFETIVNKYKGIVPALYYDNEFEKDIKYRTVVETELDYDQIIEIDLYIDELKKKGKNANEIIEMAKEKVSNISLKDNVKNKREI